VGDDILFLLLGRYAFWCCALTLRICD